MARHESATGGPAAAKVDAWWRENADRVRAYVIHMVGPADADDLVQEVFVLAMRRWEDVPEPPIGWLLRTARNVVANYVRSRRRRRDMLGRFADEESRTPATDTLPAEHDAHAELRALLEGLPANDREVLMMSAWYDLTAGEAAEALGISVNAYTVRLHRARARLAAKSAADTAAQDGEVA